MPKSLRKLYFNMLSLLSLFYNGLLLFFTAGIFNLKKLPNTDCYQPISIIIAARNEENNIANLLQCLTNQNYPEKQYEIIIADDRSQDKTAEIVKAFQHVHANIKLIRILTEKPNFVGKKNALNEAIKIASYDIFAFTDADCLPGKNWLHEINKHVTEKTDFVAGYAPLILEPKWLETLKNLERASIFAVSAGSIGWRLGITCVARNMAYRKSLFLKVNGFSDIAHLKSGDDDLMLQKMSPYIRNMRFMLSEDSFVPSKDEKSAAEQMDLETRRASKWKYYPVSVKLITLLTFLYYLFLGKSVFKAFMRNNWKQCLFPILLKITSEFVLLLTFLSKIKQKKLLLSFPLAELVYIPYFLFFALKGTFGRYKWKN